MGQVNEAFLRHLRSIREQEAQQIATYLCPEQKILELGAGAGWMTKYLAEKGYEITALDIETSLYNQAQVWPVMLYDGAHIPLPDQSIDVVFSSHVLAHVQNLDVVLAEVKRILKLDGYCVHLMPTMVWRFWTIAVFYPDLARRLFKKLVKPRQTSAATTPSTPLSETDTAQPTPLLSKLFPQRVGVSGNAFTELYFFRKAHWVALFKNTGWQIRKIEPNHLFYTGHSLLGSRLSLSARGRLTYFLGSVGQFFVVYPAPKNGA